MSDHTIRTMRSRDMGKATSKQHFTKGFALVGTYLFLCVMAVIVLFPF